MPDSLSLKTKSGTLGFLGVGGFVFGRVPGSEGILLGELVKHLFPQVPWNVLGFLLNPNSSVANAGGTLCPTWMAASPSLRSVIIWVARLFLTVPF